MSAGCSASGVGGPGRDRERSPSGSCDEIFLKGEIAAPRLHKSGLTSAPSPREPEPRGEFDHRLVCRDQNLLGDYGLRQTRRGSGRGRASYHHDPT